METQNTPIKELITLPGICSNRYSSIKTAPCVRYQTREGRKISRVWEADIEDPATAIFFTVLYGIEPDGYSKALLSYQAERDAEWSGESLSLYLGIPLEVHGTDGEVKRVTPPHRYAK